MLCENFPGNPRAYILFSDRVRSFYDCETSRLEELNLKPSQARILHFLSDFEGLSQQDACKFFNLRPSTMSGLLSSVEETGYIYRRINPDNKRMVIIHLTQKGKDTAKKIYALFNDYCRKAMKNFTEDECILLERLLLKFANQD